MSHVDEYMSNIASASMVISHKAIEDMVEALYKVRTGRGRLFILGVGGSAANASHAVNDFRKLCGIEAYAPTDNVAELTARTNDEGWDTVFSEWLKCSKLNEDYDDAVMIFSVGGGRTNPPVSTNLVKAIEYAEYVQAPILGIVGSDRGETAKRAKHCIVIPNSDKRMITPISEAFQAVIWHCLVSHPKLQINNTKW